MYSQQRMTDYHSPYRYPALEMPRWYQPRPPEEPSEIVPPGQTAIRFKRAPQVIVTSAELPVVPERAN
jgi:hypothetical protein